MKEKMFSASVGALGSLGSYMFGGWDMALKTLLLFMVLDYITGIMGAGKNKQLSSMVGFKGLNKKVMVLIIVAVSVSLDGVLGATGTIRGLVIYFYMSMEGLSILENAVRLGVPVPNKLQDMLEQLKEGNKKEIKGDN